MNAYKFTFSLLILQIFLSNFLVAQDPSGCKYKIEGRVYDQVTREPLGYVSVQVANTSMGVVTDEDGRFVFSGLCEKEYDLLFSRIGYKSVQHHHDYHHPVMDIFMAEEVFELEGITVEGKALSKGELESGTGVKLSLEQLEASKTESFGDVVSRIAGVNTISTGQNIVKPMIHGLHSNRILVVNNGVRHEFQNWGSEHAPEIDASLASEIEVIKGAATVRFGPDALGGVILVNPRKMELSTPWTASLDLTGKSNGQSGEASASIGKGFKSWSVMGGASVVQQGDLHAPDYLLTNTGKAERSAYGSALVHVLPELDIELFYSHVDQTLGILSASVFGNLNDLANAIERDTPLIVDPFSYNIDAPRQEVRHDLFKANARFVGKKHSLLLQYGQQLNRRKEFGVRRGTAPNIDLELLTRSVDLQYRHPHLGKLKGHIGAQWLQQANDNLPGTGTVPFIPNYDMEKMGAYLIESFELREDHLLEFGARFDVMEASITGREPDNTIYRNTIRYQNFSATLGYMGKLGEHSSFRSNIGTAWRPPNVAELYRFGQHSFFLEYGLWRYTIDERFDFVSTSKGILDESDREVPSEVGYKWINTFNLDKSDFRLEATGYVNYIENFIYAKPGGLTKTPRGFFVYFIYDQTNALLWGLDLAADWQHSAKWNSHLSGSYLWSKQIEENDFFAGQPPAKVSYELEYKPTIPLLRQTSLQLATHYTFRQFQHPRILSVHEFINAYQNDLDRFANDASDFDILPPPDGFFLIDAAFKTQWKKLKLQVQVKNLLNTRYRSYTDRLRYFADGLGRNLIVSVGYSF
jgi:iron complex outermembrane receptor protein